MLNILDPMTLPNAISASPFLAAMADVTNSGKDVPSATIDSPTRVVALLMDILNDLVSASIAIYSAPSVTKKPPSATPTIPMTNKSIAFFISTNGKSSSEISLSDVIIKYI